MKYGHTKQVNFPFKEAVEETKKQLKKKGFGILTEINVKDTLKKNLDVDFDNYLILGACNPPFAYEALKTEKEIGLLLPCNVIVYEDKKNVFVSTILPKAAMGFVNNPNLADIADQVENKLIEAVNNI